LKRLNNLQNDQDFYALTYCRVPVRRFGLLHESSSSIIVNLNDQLSSSSHVLPVTHLIQSNHHAFLHAMDQDLALMRTKVEQLIETPSTTLIQQPSTSTIIVRSTNRPLSELNCDGADCGCKFSHIILAIVLIALLVPLIYIYLYLVSPEELKEHHSI
jgi:chromosome condensin MukBEF MukE localization factor